MVLEWYFPWSSIDLVLKIELLIWLGAVIASIAIFWYTIVLRRPWLRSRIDDE